MYTRSYLVFPWEIWIIPLYIEFIDCHTIDKTTFKHVRVKNSRKTWLMFYDNSQIALLIISVKHTWKGMAVLQKKKKMDLSFHLLRIPTNMHGVLIKEGKPNSITICLIDKLIIRCVRGFAWARIQIDTGYHLGQLYHTNRLLNGNSNGVDSSVIKLTRNSRDPHDWLFKPYFRLRQKHELPLLEL